MVCFEPKAEIGISVHSQDSQAGYVEDSLPTLDKWYGSPYGSPPAARWVRGHPRNGDDVPDGKTTAVMNLLTSRNTSDVDITARQALVVLPRRVKDIKLKRVLLSIS